MSKVTQRYHPPRACRPYGSIRQDNRRDFPIPINHQGCGYGSFLYS